MGKGGWPEPQSHHSVPLGKAPLPSEPGAWPPKPLEAEGGVKGREACLEKELLLLGLDMFPNDEPGQVSHSRPYKAMRSHMS